MMTNANIWTTSTNKSAKLGNEMATQITHGSGFDVNHNNSVNIFATLPVPLPYNMSPAVHTVGQNSLIMAQDQSIAGYKTSASALSAHVGTANNEESGARSSFLKASMNVNSGIMPKRGPGKDSLTVHINTKEQPINNSRVRINET
jgi:hypothetical protein